MRSFDVFDTAVFRRVFKPIDIFHLLEDKLGNDFYNKRMDAEDKAREINPYYTLEDIYKFLPEFSIDNELAVEYENIYVNPDILREYNKDPKNSVFISDMYLTSDKIIKILENAGYENPKVFVSCEMKACKGTGELFTEVEKKLGGQISKHYGDNYVADLLGAKKAGIPEVVFNPPLEKHNINLPMVNDPVFEKLLAIAEVYGSPEEQLTFYVSPLISEFTKWILSKRKEGQKIFFLSRDMIVPYKLATEVLGAKDVYYLHASRKSLAPFILKSKNKSLKEHFGSMDLEDIPEKSSIKEIKGYFSKFDIRSGDIIVDIGYSGTIQACIDEMFRIKTRGLYIQTNNKIEGIDTEMFLNHSVLSYFLIVELPLGSPEDCVCSYENGNPVFHAENNFRKLQAERLTDLLFNFSKELIGTDISIYNIEQALIHLQFYPNKQLLNLFNKEIYSNKRTGESIIGFSREQIKNGKLFECYANSYAKPLFRKLLREDPELGYLEKLLGE